MSAGRLSGRFPFYYGWVMVAVAGAGVFASGPGQTYIVSVMVEPLIEETGWSRTLVSGLYSAGSIAAVVGAIAAGRALDRFGARIVLTAVAALFGLAALMMGKITSPVHLFFGFWAIRSLGQTALVLVSTSLVAIWFVRLRGRATAFTALAAPGVRHHRPERLAHGLDGHGNRDLGAAAPRRGAAGQAQPGVRRTPSGRRQATTADQRRRERL